MGTENVRGDRLYHSLEWEVVKSPRGRWRCRPRPYFILALLIAILIVGGVLCWGSHYCSQPGPAIFLDFLGKLCLLGSALLFIAGLVQQSRVVDVVPDYGVIEYRGKRYEGGYTLELRDAQLGERKLVSLWAVHGEGKEFNLIPGTYQQNRPEIERLSEGLSWTEEAAVTDVSKVYPIEAAVLIVFGLLWAAGGYLAAPNLVWMFDDGLGVMVWPFGLLMLFWGVLELLGIRILRAIKRREPATWFGVGMIALYFWLALVRL